MGQSSLFKRYLHFLLLIPIVIKIDISMEFYTFEIDPLSQRLCVISTPFGLYKYKRLPIGLTNSPRFFQSVMHSSFADLSDMEYFIYDIGIFLLGSFSQFLNQLHQVFLRLERNIFTVNPPKCEREPPQLSV